MKRQDIARDVLPYLPTPEPIKEPAKSDEPNIKAKPLEHVRVFPLKVYLSGRGGVLTILVPIEAIPKSAPLAQLATFNGDKTSKEVRLGIIFSSESGVTPFKSSRSTKLKGYSFPRKKVPFKYASKQPKGFKTPVQCARLMGHSLVCDKPLPKELLEDVKVTTPAPVIKHLSKKIEIDYSLENGSELKEIINDWVAWARAKGHEPKLTVSNEGELSISVITKVTKEL